MTIDEVQGLVALGRTLLADPNHDASDQMANVAILVENGRPAIYDIGPLRGEQTNG